MSFTELQESLLTLSKVRPLGATIALKLTDGDVIYLKSDEKGSEVTTTELSDVKTTFVLSSSDLAAMLSKAMNPTQAFMSGKMQIKGDMAIAMKLAQLMAE
jgi:putative sterol carrier protein